MRCFHATILLCCRTIERELQLAMAQTGVAPTCVWIESGLHNVPKQLTACLQQALDTMPEDTERVLLGFGYCGNAVNGLRAGNYTILLPRADDCITLLLGSYRRRKALMQEDRPYFLTQGWLDGERNIYEEYRYTVEKYGVTRARRVFDTMLAHYRHLCVVDTGAYDLQGILPRTQAIAQELGLIHQVVDGTTARLCQLLTGPWPDRDFLTVAPGGVITSADLLPPE